MKENVREQTNYHLFVLKKLIFFTHVVDRCPMYFNDGADPWNVEENHIRVFDFNDDDYNGAGTFFKMTNLLILQTLLHLLLVLF